MKKRVGLIVNPIAGMGGRVGLKGTDGPEILRKSVALGAVPVSCGRASQALKSLSAMGAGFHLFTYPREMGEDAATESGLEATTLGSIRSGATTAEDTERAARDLAAAGVDLLLFAGGDGTARNICRGVGDRLPVLGIPAGVKMHSAVFGTTPARAGAAAALFLRGRIRETRDAEVMDIDEGAFREQRLSARLYGYLRVPAEPRMVQAVKAGGSAGEASAVRGIALHVAATMDPGCCYLIGPGTTTREIMEVLGLPNTLLGVDVVLDRSLVACDVNEGQVLEVVGRRPARIVVGVIGGQGYLFGRGNQQISDRVIARVGKENIIVVACRSKLFALGGRPLLVDTGNGEVDRMLAGYVQVITGLKEKLVYPVEC
ncbi:MAG: ATP-NAD kinase family protein [bacterium]